MAAVDEFAAVTTQAQHGLPECITQDPAEPVGADYLAVCARYATEVACSIHCPPSCGGHPVCKPCLALGFERGLVVPKPSPGVA